MSTAEVVVGCLSFEQVNSLYGIDLLLPDPSWENASQSKASTEK